MDKTILKNCHRRLTNLQVKRIDYNKTCNPILHNWILNCFNMVGTVKNIRELINNSMTNWRAH